MAKIGSAPKPSRRNEEAPHSATVLPFRLRSSVEDDPHVPGQANSAPPHFSFLRTAKWTTLVAVVLFGLYYANYVNRWLLPDMIDLFSGAAERSAQGK